jgi:hypothetical protein
MKSSFSFGGVVDATRLNFLGDEFKIAKKTIQTCVMKNTIFTNRKICSSKMFNEKNFSLTLIRSPAEGVSNIAFYQHADKTDVSIEHDYARTKGHCWPG